MQTVKTPSISVIMLSYNYASFLSEAISSVLSQSLSPMELIIVEDGSDDASLDIVNQYSEQYPGLVKVLMHPGHENRGIVASYELALSQAQGEWVAFLEADDVWHSENLRLKWEAAKVNPTAGVIYSDYKAFGESKARFYWRLYALANKWGTPRNRPFAAFKFLLNRNPVASFSHFIARRVLLSDIPRPKVIQKNYDWWILSHLSTKTHFYFIPKKLVFWRIHSGSAAYGQVTNKTLWRLHLFLKVLYERLQGRIYSHGSAQDFIQMNKSLSEEVRYHAKIDKKKSWFVFERVVKSPLWCLRFLLHIVLRNLLLVK